MNTKAKQTPFEKRNYPVARPMVGPSGIFALIVIIGLAFGLGVNAYMGNKLGLFGL